MKKTCHLSSNDHEIYIYGIDTLLYTILSTFGLLSLGLVCGQLTESIVIIAIFYVNQTLGGGFHASTHLGCFLTMSIGLILLFIFLNIPFNQIIYIITGFTSISVLIFYPLVLHKNKEYLNPQFYALSKRSRLSIIIQIICYCVVISVRSTLLIKSMSAGFMACASSRLVAVIQYHRQHL